MLPSKIREALICLKAGRVTLPYPLTPMQPKPGFRGKITLEPDLCFGCGGCANVCPAGVIVISDVEQYTRVLEFFWSRCTYCGRCEEVCREGAVRLSQEFETATDNPQDMYLRLEVFMGPCQRCGRCFKAATPLDSIAKTGFRNGSEGGRA